MSEWIEITDSGVVTASASDFVEVHRRNGRYDKAMAFDIKWDDVVAYRLICPPNPTPDKSVKANNRQISGNHYMKQQVQPWDYIASNGLGFFEGNIVKYVTRWKNKGGVDDLKKAQHYLQKLIEIQQ